jgi:hypothetical protein
MWFTPPLPWSQLLPLPAVIVSLPAPPKTWLSPLPALIVSPPLPA